MKSASEKQIETAILRYLELLPECFAWKNNSVGIYDPIRKVYRRTRNRFAINGVADIIGIYKGRFLAIEVKTPKTKNRVSEDQRRFLDNISGHGGIAFVATGIEDVKYFFDKWKLKNLNC